MKYLKVFAALGVLALAGAGSAVVLESFGTISGTADVKPALKVTELKVELASGESAEKIEIYNPSTASVNLENYDVGDGGSNNTLVGLNGTDISAQGYAVIVPDTFTGYQDGVQYFEAQSALSLANSGDDVRIWTKDDFLIDSVSYADACGSDETLQRDSLTSKTFSCSSETLGTGGY